MKTKIILIILAISFIGSLNLSAQIKQANIFFGQFKYSKAAPLYKKATNNKDEKIRKEATVRLADCYRLMNNATEASVWYNKAIAFEGVDPESYYYLGTSLRSLAKYDEAEKAFNSYASKKLSDSRGQTYAQYCRDIKEWKDLTPCAEVKDAQELNSAYSDFGPMFYKGGLIFTSDRDIDMMADQNYLWTSFGYLDLYSSQLTTTDDFWNELTKPVKMPNTFNQSYHNGPASFTSDYSEIFITKTLKNSTKHDSLNMRTNLLKIFYAKLNDGTKLEYTSFPYNNEDYSVGHPAISGDGKKLIFSSDKPGGFGEGDLYISELVNGKWNQPVNLGAELNTFGNEVFPFLANDSTLFFSSDGHPGFGGLDIYETKLVNGKWTTPWNLKLPVNSTYDDFSIVFSKNMTDGFFSSNRPGGKGSDDIYAFKNYKRTPVVVEKPKPVISEKIIAKISGYVKDKKTLAPLDSVTVFLLNTNTSEVLVLKTNAEGYFETPADNGVQYIAKAMKTNHFNDCLSFSVPNELKTANITTPRDLLLDKYAVNKVFKIDNIYYDLDKWDIRDDAKPSLNKLVSILNQYPINVEIGSHTDCRASSAYNNSLSQKRAGSAVKYLISNGIEASRLTYKGYGETMLINKCADGVPCTEAEHQANRRTEFKIISINSARPAKQSFDPNTYKAGDKLTSKLLDPDFFNNCLDDKNPK
jgi:outer membrane protein OmpA-like peptidoglycan-associated protein/tetratricopeptide (TPR) repeat protein